MQFFMNCFGSVRKVYNLMLEDAIKTHKQTGKFDFPTPAYYKDDYPFLREVDSLALANAWMNLKQSFVDCFSKSRKKNTGFPRFKSAKRCRKSYTTNEVNGNIALFEDGIKLPKVGVVKAVIHRKPEDSWKLKSVTVSCDPDGCYYASVLFEYDAQECNYVIDPDNSIGLDYSSKGLYVNQDGEIGSNHKYFAENQKKLAREKRRLSRKEQANIDYYEVDNKGYRYPVYRRPLEECKNYQKQRIKVAKLQKHVANQRLDNLHKKSVEIANQHDVVCVEDLNMRAMANRKFGNGKATLDNGYGKFLVFLDYKLRDRGKRLIKVSKWFPSSQLCSCCGHRNPELKDLRIRKWECPFCHAQHDRDVNASRNILKEGLRLLALETT